MLSIVSEYSIPNFVLKVCSMNQVRKSAIVGISRQSTEFAVIRGFCRQDFSWGNDTSTNGANWDLFKKTLLKVRKCVWVI